MQVGLNWKQVPEQCTSFAQTEHVFLQADNDRRRVSRQGPNAEFASDVGMLLADHRTRSPGQANGLATAAHEWLQLGHNWRRFLGQANSFGKTQYFLMQIENHKNQVCRLFIES